MCAWTNGLRWPEHVTTLDGARHSPEDLFVLLHSHIAAHCSLIDGGSAPAADAYFSFAPPAVVTARIQMSRGSVDTKQAATGVSHILVPTWAASRTDSSIRQRRLRGMRGAREAKGVFDDTVRSMELHRCMGIIGASTGSGSTALVHGERQ